MPWMISGSIARFAESYVLTLRLYDVRNALVAGRVSRRVKGDEEDLLDEIPDIIQELFDRVANRLRLHRPDRVSAASRHPQPVKESPSSVIVITRKEIEESGAATLVDLLRLYPNMHVVMINPSHHLVYFRGSYRVLLLLDGRELNMELFPTPFYEFIPVGINDIERIEIVFGPNSALYGANAVAAVINITSRKPRSEFGTDLSIAAGQNGATILGGLVEGGAGPWSFQGNFGFDREHSWMSPSEVTRDFRRAGCTVHLALHNGNLSLNGGLVTGSGLLFSDGIGYMPFHDFLFSHAKAELSLGGLSARAYWFGAQGDLDVEMLLAHPSDPSISLGDLPSMQFIGDTAHLEAQYDLEPFEDNRLIGGADFRYTNYRSEQTVDREMSEYRFGVFLRDEHRFTENLLVTGGARLDINVDPTLGAKTRTAISPQLAVVYNPVGEHIFRLSGGTAFRKPTLIETSGNFIVDENPTFPEINTLFEEIGISNPDLDNEQLTTVELGYLGSFFDKSLRFNSNLYFASNQNTIELDVDIVMRDFMQIDMEATKLGYINRDTQSNLIGASFSVDGDPLKYLTLFFRGEYRREWLVEDGDWTYLHSQFLSSAGAVARFPFDLTAHLALVYAGASTDTLPSPVSILALGTWKDMPARSYLMASAVYRLDLRRARLHLGLSLMNPFGPRFREKLGEVRPNGSNFGGELLGPRVMLTANLRY
jgi:hypothetical protein